MMAGLMRLGPWSHQGRPMVPSGKTSKEKRIAREKAGSELEGEGGGKRDTASNSKKYMLIWFST
jgi:hypothetical protein